MGIIITPDGKKRRLSPEKDFFTLYEISDILGGLIDISFVGDKWIFVNKLGHKLDLGYNETASVLFNYPIAGPCIIADQEELPPQFFMDDKKFDSSYDYEDEDEDDDINDRIQKRRNESETKKEDVNNDDKLKEDIIKEANYLLFETGKTTDEILENFIVYRRGNNTINYTGNLEKQLDILNDMMNYFLKIEEYEKCQNISNLMQIIKK